MTKGTHPKPVVGRPARTGDAAQHVVCARLTDSERRAWELAASGAKLGEWVREVCNREAGVRSNPKAKGKRS
jgi:hypothetical protein